MRDTVALRASGVESGTVVNFADRPFTVVWEVTRACDLRCVHCRADAQSCRDPRELTTQQAFRLLEQVRDLNSPVFVITGGDPLKRADLFDLIADAVGRGLSVAVTPSGTPLLTRDAVQRMRDLGVKRMALSLDGPTPEIHDHFRQQPGSYGWTVAGIAHAQACQLPVQINTTVTRRNLALLPAIARRVAELGAAMWSAFFLVNVGRAHAADQLEPQEYEHVFAFLHDLSGRAPFAVRTTAAPHYRRFVLQRRTAAKRIAPWLGAPLRVAGLVGDLPVRDLPVGDLPRASRGVTDGNGIVFISHTGEVYPSGFLPLSAGNVLRTPLAEIYRHAPLFRQLRDVAQLRGKCGECEFVHVCAGSRARAYALTGDPMAEEPLCTYHPRRWRPAAAAVG